MSFSSEVVISSFTFASSADKVHKVKPALYYSSARPLMSIKIRGSVEPFNKNNPLLSERGGVKF
jgi:hypothetical protein